MGESGGSRVFTTVAAWDERLGLGRTTVTAADSATGQEVWSTEYQFDTAFSLLWDSGILHMICVVGDEGWTLTVDAATGEELWRQQTGAFGHLRHMDLLVTHGRRIDVFDARTGHRPG